MWLKNPGGKNSFCKLVKKIYFTGYYLGAGRYRVGEDLLQGKPQYVYMYVCGGSFGLIFWVSIKSYIKEATSIV